MRDGLAAKGDARGAIVPRPADIELDIPAIGLVLEGDGRLVGEDCGCQETYWGKWGRGIRVCMDFEIRAPRTQDGRAER